MSYDGDYNTYFQSIEGVDVTKTFRIVYTLEEGHTLNRILLTPRADNSLGVFSKFEIEVSTTGMPASFIKVASIEREEGDQSPLNLILDTPAIRTGLAVQKWSFLKKVRINLTIHPYSPMLYVVD